MKNKNTLTIIGIIMLLLAIPSGFMPYGYYQFLRIDITLLAGYLCFLAYKSEKQFGGIVMAGVTILFNPIIPIYLDKTVWLFFDIITIAILSVSLIKLKN